MAGETGVDVGVGTGVGLAAGVAVLDADGLTTIIEDGFSLAHATTRSRLAAGAEAFNHTPERS